MGGGGGIIGRGETGVRGGISPPPPGGRGQRQESHEAIKRREEMEEEEEEEEEEREGKISRGAPVDIVRVGGRRAFPGGKRGHTRLYPGMCAPVGTGSLWRLPE